MGMHFLSLLSARCLSRTNSPNWLICDDDLSQSVGREVKERFLQLGLHKLILCTSFPNRQRFTATKNWGDKKFQTQIDFIGQHRICFTKVFPAFTMPDDTV